MSQQFDTPAAVQPPEQIPPAAGPVLIAGIVRTAGVLVLGGIGIVIWRALAMAGAGRTITGGSVTGESAQQLVIERLGSSLGSLALALLLGAAIGFSAAGLRTVLGRAGGAVGWFAATLWTPPVPVALAMAFLAMTAGAGRAVVVGLALSGVVAVLVAVAVSEPWQRRAWLPGTLAGVAAAGQGLAAITGALLVVEPLVGLPGLGSLVVRSLATLDTYATAAAITTLLLFALVGQLLGAVAGTLGEWLDKPAAAVVAERPGLRGCLETEVVESRDPNVGLPVPGGSPNSSAMVGFRPAPAAGVWARLSAASVSRHPLSTVLSVAALVTLVLPVLAVAGSLFAGSGTTLFPDQANAGPSLGHLLGTDMLGRDLLGRLLIGFRDAWLVTIAGIVVAAVLGLVWGAVAVLLERQLPRGGRVVAEALLAPGRLVTVAPLLVAGVVLVGVDRWFVVIAIAVMVTPRLAAAVVSSARPLPASPLPMIREAGGLLLIAWGVALAVVTGLQFVGVGAAPPAPSFGAVLADLVRRLLIAGPAGVLTTLATLALLAPFFLAGWSLLRQPRRAEALAALET